MIVDVFHAGYTMTVSRVSAAEIKATIEEKVRRSPTRRSPIKRFSNDTFVPPPPSNKE